MSLVDFVGYAASGLVIVSLMMRSVVRLRLISLCGSAAFFAYGLLIGSTPILATNVCIAAINLHFLRREFAGTDNRDDLGASRIRSDSPFLLDFVEYHLDDIRRFQPDFTMPDGDGVTSLLLTRDGLPAGLVVGRREGNTLTVDLDYVLREHRDSRLGRWLYGPGADVFRSAEITELRSHAATHDYEKYLRGCGFTPRGTANIFALSL